MQTIVHACQSTIMSATRATFASLAHAAAWMLNNRAASANKPAMLFQRFVAALRLLRDDFQRRDTLEVLGVVRHKRHAVPHSTGRNPCVIGRDRLPAALTFRHKPPP